MLGRIISTNLKLSHLSSLGISILQFILIGAKKAPKQVQSLIEQTHQQVVDPNNQRNVIELIEKIIIYKFTHHGTALRWRQSIMLGVHALKQLYELDDSQWLGETISLLRNHQFQQLDLEHLIEELEDLTCVLGRLCIGFCQVSHPPLLLLAGITRTFSAILRIDTHASQVETRVDLFFLKQPFSPELNLPAFF